MDPICTSDKFSQRQPVERDNLTATKPQQTLNQLQQPHNDTLACTGRIQHPVTRKKHEVNILLDSGNSIQSCAVISLRCATDLKLKILPHKTTIGTADSSNPMTSKGKNTTAGTATTKPEHTCYSPKCDRSTQAKRRYQPGSQLPEDTQRNLNLDVWKSCITTPARRSSSNHTNTPTNDRCDHTQTCPNSSSIRC